MKKTNPYQTLESDLRAVRPLSKRVPVTPPGTGFTSVNDGVEYLTYKLLVDRSALHGLACKAAANKNGKSKIGPFVIFIEKRGKKQ